MSLQTLTVGSERVVHRDIMIFYRRFQFDFIACEMKVFYSLSSGGKEWLAVLPVWLVRAMHAGAEHPN